MCNKPRAAEPKQNQCCPLIVAETQLSTPRQRALGVAFDHAVEVAGFDDEMAFPGAGCVVANFRRKSAVDWCRFYFFEFPCYNYPRLVFLLLSYFVMAFPKNNLNKFSAQNLLVSRAIHSRRAFLKLSTSAGALAASAAIPAAVASLIAPQRLEAAESSRSINWKEILGQFGESVPIPGEVDASGKDMIVGRTMNEIYALYVQQQKDWCAKDAAYCEGETPHAKSDNRVLVPSDYILSVPIPRAGQSVTSRDADKIPSIYLPLNGYATTQNIADFSGYANEILGLSGKYSDLQMVGENGESRSLLLSKQGVPVFFSAEELLFIYAHYRMNKVTAEEIKFAGTVLDYGGVNSAAQARALRYKRIGNVRAAGMNNLQTALRVMFNHHRYINETNDQSIDSTAPFGNYHTMTEDWNTDFYWKGGERKISAEQTQARIRAMLAKDPEPLGNYGESALKWWSSTKFTLPKIKDSQGNEISAENPIDLANQLYPNDPLKAMMLIGNLQLELYFRYALKKKTSTRKELINTNSTSESKMANRLNRGIRTPREFLVESS